MAIAAKEAHFCDSCRQIGIFCSVERVKRFVNVHLHCIVSNLKRMSKISTLPSSWKNFCGRPRQRHVGIVSHNQWKAGGCCTEMSLFELSCLNLTKWEKLAFVSNKPYAKRISYFPIFKKFI